MGAAKLFGMSSIIVVAALLLATGLITTPPAVSRSNTLAILVPDFLFPASLMPEVARLQEYLRIRTDHPSPDYAAAMDFIEKTAKELIPIAEFRRLEPVEGKPIALITLKGLEPKLPALMLNSHTDVVPAERKKWRWNPFGAQLACVDYEWRIYGRGSQDMKSVGMQYLEALRELLESGWAPKRTIHVTFVPDEEIGGLDGLGALVNSGRGREWRKMNVGAQLDEGLPNPRPGYNVYYGERQPWWLVIEVEGEPGHGALSPETTAGLRINEIITRANAYRKGQLALSRDKESGESFVGDVVGVNLVFSETGIPSDKNEAGYLMNLVPSIARAGFDIRIPPDVDVADVEAEIQSWLDCPLDGATLSAAEKSKRCLTVRHAFVHKVMIPEVTRDAHPFARAFHSGLQQYREEKKGPLLRPATFFAATDARFVREAGVPSIGFSPMESQSVLLHKHDEYIPVKGYLDGIKAYKMVLKSVSGEWPDTSLGDTLGDTTRDAAQAATEFTVVNGSVEADGDANQLEVENPTVPVSQVADDRSPAQDKEL